MKILHWTPRVICMLAIIFISLFAFDAFDPGLTAGQQLEAFTIHLIPSFILLGILLLAWKWELAGGIIFILTGIALSPVIFLGNFHSNHSVIISLTIIATITFPFVIAGILFVFSYFRKKKASTA